MPRANANVNAKMATKRRALPCAFGATGLAATIPVRAQPSGKVRRIGILSPRALPAQPATDLAYGSFLQSLQEQGFTDGKNVASGPRRSYLPSVNPCSCRDCRKLR